LLVARYFSAYVEPWTPVNEIFLIKFHHCFAKVGKLNANAQSAELIASSQIPLRLEGDKPSEITCNGSV